MKNREHQEQVALFDLLRRYEARHPVLKLAYAIPNGGKRNVITARKLKAEGVRAGVSDIHLPVARNGYHGLWIEMKFGKGKPTDKQKAWLEAMRNQGHRAEVCYRWDQAAKIIFTYLGIEGALFLL